MKSKRELKKYLLENFVDRYGNINLSGLDFSDFEGDVDISYMKVKHNLFQQFQEVKGGLFQNCQVVSGLFIQDESESEVNY